MCYKAFCLGKLRVMVNLLQVVKHVIRLSEQSGASRHGTERKGNGGETGSRGVRFIGPPDLWDPFGIFRIPLQYITLP